MAAGGLGWAKRRARAPRRVDPDRRPRQPRVACHVAPRSSYCFFPGGSQSPTLKTPSRTLSLALAMAAGPAYAMPEFVAPVEGDWFDPASWSSGSVPTSLDDPFIVNGATAQASSASPLYPGGPVEVGSLGIGTSSPAGLADAGGRLDLEDVDLSVVRLLEVGFTGFTSAASGSAWGVLDVSAG